MVSSQRNATLARARRRRESAGAAIFVVAITLGLLAAMGVYGLSATALDVRAAGQERAAAQAQHAAELAIVEAASTIGPGTATTIVRAMQADANLLFSSAGNTKSCKTAKTYNATDPVTSRIAEACMVLSPSEMRQISPNTNWGPVDGNPIAVPFSTKSFGDVPLVPYVRIELTNPINWDAPAGFQTSSNVGAKPPVFTQIRATVFLELRQNGLLSPADYIATGRGRLVVGPYTP